MESKIHFKPPTKKDYDGAKFSYYMHDEAFFNESKFEKLLRLLEEPKHRIGVVRSENNNAYCLLREHNKEVEILMIKIIKDRKQFNWEVDCLTKIFNATVIEETD